MGAEATCSVSYGGRSASGRALLETTELIFRGDFRLRIPFESITSLDSAAGSLRVGFENDVAVFDLGRNADIWAVKIRNPRGLLEKLGVKDEMSVAVLGVRDEGFMAQLGARTARVTLDTAPADADFVFYEADSIDDLCRLAALRAGIKPKGAVWVVSPKGKGAVLKDTDVMAAAREAGLVATKVVAFSETHTALKLVIPVAKRT